MEAIVAYSSTLLWAHVKITPPSNVRQTVTVQIQPVSLSPPNPQIWLLDNQQPTNTTAATTMATCKTIPTAYLHQLPHSVLYQSGKIVPWKADHLLAWP